MPLHTLNLNPVLALSRLSKIIVKLHLKPSLRTAAKRL